MKHSKFCSFVFYLSLVKKSVRKYERSIKWISSVDYILKLNLIAILLSSLGSLSKKKVYFSEMEVIEEKKQERITTDANRDGSGCIEEESENIEETTEYIIKKDRGRK